MNNIIGYARVSTADQKRSTQIDFLKLLGCQKIPQEKISTFAKDRISYHFFDEINGF